MLNAIMELDRALNPNGLSICSPCIWRAAGPVLLWLGVSLPAHALDAPNVVHIDAHLTTSGQPSAAQLSDLAAQGYQAVINLAPPTVSDAVPEEAAIVARQGMAFVNIPIPFEHPTAGHYRTFAAVLTALGERKVLVHCQVNLRASTMVFLYRTLVRKDDPQTAFDDVQKVWTPRGPWKNLYQRQLRAHGLRFEPF